MKRLPKNTLTKGGESRATMEPSHSGAANACCVVRRPLSPCPSARPVGIYRELRDGTLAD
jgi:hypothetical protein